MIKYIKISDRKKVFFWVMDNTGEIQYSFYNAEKLNAELDKKESEESKFVPCTSSAVKSACYGSFNFLMEILFILLEVLPDKNRE